MADGAFSLGLADPAAILNAVYAQQQAQQPGAFTPTTPIQAPTLDSASEYANLLAQRRAESLRARQAIGPIQGGEGLDQPLQAPRYAFGTVFEDPRVATRRQALQNVVASSKDQDISQADLYANLAKTLQAQGDLGGAVDALKLSASARAAEAPISKMGAGQIQHIPGGSYIPDPNSPGGFRYLPKQEEDKAKTMAHWQEGKETVSGFYDPKNPQANDKGWVEVSRGPMKEGVNIGINVGEKEYVKESVDYLKQLRTEAADSAKLKASTQYMDKLLTGIDTNQATAVAASLGPLAKMFGYSNEEVARLQASRSLMSDMTLTNSMKMKGNLSDGDRTFVSEMVPNIAQTPQGRKALADFNIELYNRSILKYKMADEFRKNNADGSLYPLGKESFDSQWDKYLADHPLTEKLQKFVPKTKINPSQALQTITGSDGKPYYNMGTGKWIDINGQEMPSGR